MMMMKARCFPTACIALRISATSKLFKDSKELKKNCATGAARVLYINILVFESSGELN